MFPFLSTMKKQTTSQPRITKTEGNFDIKILLLSPHNGVVRQCKTHKKYIYFTAARAGRRSCVCIL